MPAKSARSDQKNDQKFENLDNYQLVTTEAVLFPTGKSNLTREAKEQLDQAVDQIKGNKNYVVEVRGFTDKTGSPQVQPRAEPETSRRSGPLPDHAA